MMITPTSVAYFSNMFKLFSWLLDVTYLYKLHVPYEVMPQNVFDCHIIYICRYFAKMGEKIHDHLMCKKEAFYIFWSNNN